MSSYIIKIQIIMNKTKMKCSSCEESYELKWENEDLEPISCPFCGAAIDNSDEVDFIEESTDDEDNWN